MTELSASKPSRDQRAGEKIDAITGLADESVCPTLVSKGLGFGGAGALACQPIFSQTQRERLLTEWPDGV
jgi:hypothetical protein